MRFTFFVLFLFTCGLTHAQVIVKEFFTKDGKPANEQSSYYYRVGEKALIEVKSGLAIKMDTVFIDTVKTFYTATHKIRSREFYLEGRREGAFMKYHENGRLKEKGTYYEGQKAAYLIGWYETGVVQKMLKYFPTPSATFVSYPRDSFQIINYWNESNAQLVKNGSGYCTCYLDSDTLLKKGKVVNGAQDSTWQYLIDDTVRFVEEFRIGKFLEGKTYHMGKEIQYHQVETMAEFPGGIQELMTFIRKIIRYPLQAKRMGVEGKVFVKFIVDKDGHISNLSIVKGVSKELDDESLRIFKLMPLWTPCKIRGIPVKSEFVFPVYFKLD